MVLPADIVIACAITAVVGLFCGYKIGYWTAHGCIHNVADELRKQLDIDGQPFERMNDDFDDDDDDENWLGDPDSWKKR